MNILEQTLYTQAGMNGLELVTGTGSNVAPYFVGVQAIGGTNTVVASLVGPGTNLAAITMQPNSVIYAQFTGITLTSGQVLLYKGNVGPNS